MDSYVALVACLLAAQPLACSKKPAGEGTAVEANSTQAIYTTRGVIKAFGEGRRSVKIAHEDVPGYMKAMTMPFSVNAPSVLDGLAEGDKVEFSFVEEADGHLAIRTLKKL